jgi:hypothetical protein
LTKLIQRKYPKSLLFSLHPTKNNIQNKLFFIFSTTYHLDLFWIF